MQAILPTNPLNKHKPLRDRVTRDVNPWFLHELFLWLVSVPTWYWEFEHLTALSAFFIQRASKGKPAISSGPSLRNSNLFQHWRKHWDGMWSLLWCFCEGFARVIVTIYEFHVMLIPYLCYSTLVLDLRLQFRLLFKFYLNSSLFRFFWICQNNYLEVRVSSF